MDWKHAILWLAVLASLTTCGVVDMMTPRARCAEISLGVSGG